MCTTGEISSKAFNFDRRFKAAAAVKTVTREELLEFFDTYIAAPTGPASEAADAPKSTATASKRRKFAVHVRAIPRWLMRCCCSTA